MVRVILATIDDDYIITTNPDHLPEQVGNRVVGVGPTVEEAIQDAFRALEFDHQVREGELEPRCLTCRYFQLFPAGAGLCWDKSDWRRQDDTCRHYR